MGGIITMSAMPWRSSRVLLCSLWAILFLSVVSARTRMKLAVVTGANKGIGFEICKKLGQAGVKTIVACRNEALGLAAADELKAAGFQAEYRNLDISDDLSIGRFARDMEEDYGGIDILVNNAAIAFKGSDPTPFKDQCFPTINPNFFGTLKLTESLLPLLRKAASPRLVSVASQAGHLRIIKSEELRNKFVNCGSLDELEGLMTSFVEDVQNGVHEAKGWPSSNYGMSKLGVIAMTRILAKREEAMHPGTAMRITCCCPGYCATDMSSHKGTRTAEHGARTPAMLALVEICGSGGFYLDEAEVEW